MMESSPTKRRIGIIGGSFDPVHIGHLIIAQDAAEQLGLSEVVFVPAAVPPHKQHLQRADAEHRLKMLQIAIAADTRFSVSDTEVLRGGVSYTIDTLKEFCASHQEAELFLIVGSDTLVDLHTWYKIDLLLERCEVATLVRPGEVSRSEMAKKIKLPMEQKEKLLRNVITAHSIEISSTEIRQRLSRGESICYLVPHAVELYIKEQSLYQG